MIIPDLKEAIGKYNIRKYEEHAYRSTVYVAKHRLLVMERRGEKFTLEVVDNEHNVWHTIEEFEFSDETSTVSAIHEFLAKNCGYTKAYSTWS